MKKILKAVMWSIIIFMTIGAFTACQPTPEEPIVIARDNTEKEVYDSAENTGENKINFAYETTEHITDRYSIIEGSLDVEIDADVNMPNISSVPVAKVTSDPFTQEKVDELIDYFAQGGTLINKYISTKDDYDEMIVEAKQGHLVDGEYVYDESNEEWVAHLLEERQKAPDEDIQEPIGDYGVSEKNESSCRIKKDGQITGGLNITGDIFTFYSNKSYRYATENYYDYMTGEQIEMSTKEIKMTDEEAVKTAQGFFEDLGIKGMALSEIDKIYFTEDENMLGDIKYGGYTMIFMREFGGIMPLNITSYGRSLGDKFDVSPPINVERIMINVDEYGNVTSFRWQNPIRIVETLTEHVDILPFEDIMVRFKEFSKLQFGYVGGNLGNVMCIKEVYRIDFKLMYLPLKNNSTEFMYAPCWVFTYKERVEYTEEQKKKLELSSGYLSYDWDIQSDEYLIFSAVDGASVSAYSSKWIEEIEERKKEINDD